MSFFDIIKMKGSELMAGGRPRAFKNKQELEDALQRYKDYLRETNKPPTIAGLSYFTGIDRQSIYNYQKRDEYFDTIKSFRDWVMMTYEEIAIEKGNGGIVFLLKNYGYTDKQDIDLNGNLGLKIEIDYGED